MLIKRHISLCKMVARAPRVSLGTRPSDRPPLAGHRRPDPLRTDAVRDTRLTNHARSPASRALSQVSGLACVRARPRRRRRPPPGRVQVRGESTHALGRPRWRAGRLSAVGVRPFSCCSNRRRA
ncbi:hypothetical protein PsYK624_042310 [Phanerochaete sordida]|uniref:Uncharacterized protein n=1 Tax=Phanerochaete sordida TaxID=48140 RepID=A0A9P3G4J0_9APHY|nr:hypothetical protein PsYK624_042310 [Phanerochaete sordida]